ncbi:uncharacterized protein LOC126910177 [Daktulosphaira vitifoliae]|uniref:uncharacterized protein LOC126910177 n=1 Tax=Daktulosphaira vitifoliae TaxID=58002 RepID=UPI0021AA12CC|nr:uncharacterized protein LOC126910177 [Daktulosphaira vitifoliae]
MDNSKPIKQILNIVFRQYFQILSSTESNIESKLNNIIYYCIRLFNLYKDYENNGNDLDISRLSISNVKPQFKDVYQSIRQLTIHHDVELDISYAFIENDNLNLDNVIDILCQIQQLMIFELDIYLE